MWGIPKPKDETVKDEKEKEVKEEVKIQKELLKVCEKKIQAYHYGETNMIYMIILKDELNDIGYQYLIWDDPTIYINVEVGKTYEISYVKKCDNRIIINKIECM